MKSPQHVVPSAYGMYIKTPGKRMEKRLPGVFCGKKDLQEAGPVY